MGKLDIPEIGGLHHNFAAERDRLFEGGLQIRHRGIDRDLSPTILRAANAAAIPLLSSGAAIIP